MAVGDAYVFPGFLTPVLTQLFFPKPLTTFLTCFCRGERQKFAGKKSHLNWGLNIQPPGLESNMLTTGLLKFGFTPLIPNHIKPTFKDPTKETFWKLDNLSSMYDLDLSKWNLQIALLLNISVLLWSNLDRWTGACTDTSTYTKVS